MKAIIQTKYGSPDVLQLQDIEKPIPNNNEVLVKVCAASVTTSTLFFVKGKPLIVRPMSGFLKPKFEIPGADISGRVESVGKNIKQFKSGDDVFCDLSDIGRGAFAEFVTVPENALTLKPTNISYEEAAAVPEAALVALQALRDTAKIQPEQKVLINGASGGIGSFAVQIAKYYGAEVTGVCSSQNLELVRSIGADHVIDYNQEDFTKSKKNYDLILATVGNHSILDYKRVLSPKGRYVVTGGSMFQIFQGMLLGPILSQNGGKKLTSMIVKPNQDLQFIKELIETDNIKPLIDRIYPLNKVAEALCYYEKGHSRGKVIITIENNNLKK